MPELPSLNHRHHDAVRVRSLLRDPAARREANAFVLEGPRIVADALIRGVELESVFLGPGAREAFAPLVTRLDTAQIPIRDLKEGVLEKIGSTRTPQPVLAVARMPVPATVTNLRPGLVLVGAAISDPGNLGTMLRAAEAAGATGVVVAGGVDPWNPKVVRGSAGAVLGVPIVGVEDLHAALESLRGRGWRAVGADASADTVYTDADLRGSCALVLGSEAHGLDAELTASLDALVQIPMAGEIESLNVAVAASILMFEAARQTRG
ncbi:MAG: RNA methyltransferase [Acidimicrobiia bacterium]|nr:RNA methyltransferase [Acidimicrobiia bacterium]